MAGEHRTQIRDDPSARAVLGDDSRNQHLSITLHEDTVYLLRIQLDCSQQRIRDSYEMNCNLMYDVNVWIDSNDDGQFDDSENAVPFRWPLDSYTPQGVYDVQVVVPILDGRKTKTGSHRMRLVAALNDQYRRKCANNEYRETRDYTITIVPRSQEMGETGVPYLKLPDNVCSQTNGRIVLVIMAGEQGTHIRDNIPTTTVLRETQNRHHLAVSLHEGTTYRLRIQLDCDPRSSRASLQPNCNLAQDINVWIDFNNDGQFDDSESRVPHRWPLHSTMPLGIYDLKINVPNVDGQYTRVGSHRMRIVMQPSDEYRRKCGRTDYSETREYTVNIIPRTTYGYGVSTTTHCAPGSFICADNNAGILSVNLVGERNTQIRDDTRKCSNVDNYDDRSDQVATLYENTVYTLRIELYCVQQQYGYDNSYYQDSSLFETTCQNAHYLDVWVDFNNDGVFDESRERLVSSDRYTDGRRTSQYDLSITIPQVDGRNNLDGNHRMRVILTQDARYRKPCQNTGYGEARDYTVQIVRKPIY